MRLKNITPLTLVLFLVLPSILVVVILISTQLKASAITDSLLSDSLCSIPCWQGIIPGITLSNDALSILQDSKLIARGSIDSSKPSDDSGGVTWKWRTRDTELKAKLWWRDGIVREVVLPIPGISVDDIISRYGPPEKVHVNPIGIPETWEWGVTLYFSTTGLEIQSNNLFGFDAWLKPSNNISLITLFEPSTVEERILSEGYNIEDLNLQNWKGYGIIADLYYNQ